LNKNINKLKIETEKIDILFNIYTYSKNIKNAFFWFFEKIYYLIIFPHFVFIFGVNTLKLFIEKNNNFYGVFGFFYIRTITLL
jgi:hypothetical protein